MCYKLTKRGDGDKLLHFSFSASNSPLLRFSFLVMPLTYLTGDVLFMWLAIGNCGWHAAPGVVGNVCVYGVGRVTEKENG